MSPEPHLDIVFFGSGPFAVPSLERLALISREHLAGVSCDLGLVVSRPARPAGRGKKLRRNLAQRRAEELGLSVETPSSVNSPEFLEVLAALDPDLFIVADFGEFLGRRFRELPRIGAYNLHASLLPRHRGAAPVSYALLEGDARTGVTLFRIEREMDAGPVVSTVEVEIRPDENAAELEERLAEAAADLLERSLPSLASGDFTETPQNPDLVTLAPRLAKAEGRIDWRRPAASVHRRIRAMNPWPGATALLWRGAGAERLRIVRARPVETPDDTAMPGRVVAVEGDALTVACGEGALEIQELQRAGKSPLPTSEFLRGFPIRPGDTFAVTEADGVGS